MGEVVAMVGIQRRGLSVSQSLLASAALWALGVLVATTLPAGAWRTGILAGVAAAVISGIAGLIGVILTAGRPLNAMLLARMLTFFLRMTLVGLGVLLCIKGFGETLPNAVRTQRALAFVAAFFPLFFVSTAIEHLTSVVRGPAGTVTPLTAGGSR